MTPVIPVEMSQTLSKVFDHLSVASEPKSSFQSAKWTKLSLSHILSVIRKDKIGELHDFKHIIIDGFPNAFVQVRERTYLIYYISAKAGI
jgi:hypothetical protein